MDWLSKVSQHHKEYIRYVHKMGNTSHAEDLVQEMYLRLDKYNCADKVIRENGEVNKTYVWRVLRNLFTSYKTSSGKFQFIELDVNYGTFDMRASTLYVQDKRQYKYVESNMEQEEAYERIMQKLFKEIDALDEDGYPYNKELFNLYANSAMSMRCISSVTNISLTSIYNTLKNCREQLSDELREDIEDYNNGDFERI